MKVANIPIETIGTRLSYLRSGTNASLRNGLALQEPLTVIADGDGSYELVDGFKRLTSLRQNGTTEVPVIIQDWDLRKAKAMMAVLNSRQKTMTFYEECSLILELQRKERQSLDQIAKSLGHDGNWVHRRLMVKSALAPGLHPFLEAGQLKPTSACHLARIEHEEQMALFLSARDQKLTHQDIGAAVNLILSLPAEERGAVAEDPASYLREPVSTEEPSDSDTSDIEKLATAMDEVVRELHALDDQLKTRSPESKVARVLDAAVRRLLNELLRRWDVPEPFFVDASPAETLSPAGGRLEIVERKRSTDNEPRTETRNGHRHASEGKIDPRDRPDPPDAPTNGSTMHREP